MTRPVLRDALADALARTADLSREDLASAPGLITLVGLTSQAEHDIRVLLQESVTSARSAGASWDAIGRELGMSRQAAQQRFGRGETQDSGGRRVLGPVTAFTEMAELELAGRQGWHSVEFHAFQHVVEHSDTQWEHRRVTSLGTARARLEREGWQVIGSWFPWTYLKRDLGVPAHPKGSSQPADRPQSP